jgi:eukaryotic-like serine/threonine-protein kinase
VSTAFPQPFGPYTLVSKLGVGGMAITYRARRLRPDGSESEVAIKCMLPHLLHNRPFVQLFIDEARTAVRLTHPNIAHVTDFGDVDGQLYLAMEYVHGKSLSVVLDRARKLGARALPRAEGLWLGCLLCEALNYAHKVAGVVHRDVSPDNLLLSYDGVLKLIDFGIAEALSVLPKERRSVGGKYRYASPEQQRNEAVDQRTDVYSAAVVVYELVTGRRPYEGDVMEVMRKLKEGALPLPSSIDGALAPLDGPLFRALNPVRGKRTRSVQMLLGELYEQLVVLAPEFDPDDIKHLVKFLFEDEIAAENGGRRPRIPAGYAMRMDKWLASPPPQPGPAGDTTSSSMSLPRVPLGHSDPTGLHQPPRSDTSRELAPIDDDLDDE